MTAQLGIQSLTQPQNQYHYSLSPSLTASAGSWMWNLMQDREDDDSWEVKAFAEDTGSVMGTTWPPRSYTCTFCRRDFRSAQALGGHMNVHRRDRARLNQAPRISINPTSSSSESSFGIPAQDFVSNGGLCFFYQIPNPNGGFTHTTFDASNIQSPSTFLPISAYPPNNLLSPCSPTPSIKSRVNGHSGKVDEPSAAADNCTQELDLELRLGHGPSPS